jgi:plastocyanin
MWAREDRSSISCCPLVDLGRLAGIRPQTTESLLCGAMLRHLEPEGLVMQSLISRLWLATVRLSPGRTVAIAMLLGPAVGALLAFGAVAAQEENVVTIHNFAFAPQELTVAVGATVKWVNHDDTPHILIDKNKAFRSKALDIDESFSFTFASAGTFDYFCGLHPYMVGKIIVK